MFRGYRILCFTIVQDLNNENVWTHISLKNEVMAVVEIILNPVPLLIGAVIRDNLDVIEAAACYLWNPRLEVSTFVRM